MSDYMPDVLKHVLAADKQLEQAHDVKYDAKAKMACSALASAHIDMARMLLSLHIEDDIARKSGR